jgi:hypothetical protein
MAGRGEIEQAAAAPPLLRGEDVMRALALEPGPAVGLALARIREAQAIGLVSTRAEALAHLRQVAGLAGPSLDSADEGPIE